MIDGCDDDISLNFVELLWTDVVEVSRGVAVVAEVDVVVGLDVVVEVEVVVVVGADVGALVGVV